MDLASIIPPLVPPAAAAVEEAPTLLADRVSAMIRSSKFLIEEPPLPLLPVSPCERKEREREREVCRARVLALKSEGIQTNNPIMCALTLIDISEKLIRLT